MSADRYTKPVRLVEIDVIDIASVAVGRDDSYAFSRRALLSKAPMAVAIRVA